MDRSLDILLVDDEEIVRQTIGEFLRASGHRTDDACDGAAALKAVEAAGYDLILVDVGLPDMDGLSLLGRIRKARPEVPVVVIAGHGSPEMASRARELGATDFLEKPIRLLELEAVLEKTATKGPTG